MTASIAAIISEEHSLKFVIGCVSILLSNGAASNGVNINATLLTLSIGQSRFGNSSAEMFDLQRGITIRVARLLKILLCTSITHG